MRIISQNGELDIPYENARILLNEETNASGICGFYLTAEYPGEDNEYILGHYDTREEGKAMIVSIAKSWMRNYPIFYCTKEEDKIPKAEGGD